MHEIWVLSIRTSLPETCIFFSDMQTEFLAFDSFEKAKTILRERLKELTFSPNAMFNGKGQITLLDKYISGMWAPEDDSDVDDDVLSNDRLTKIQDALTAAFSGQDVRLDIKDGDYTDWMIAVCVKENSVSFRGDDDGPINGYDPVLKTNIFSMEEPQDYYLYINDRFGQYDEATSELYVDLKRAEIL